MSDLTVRAALLCSGFFPQALATRWGCLRKKTSEKGASPQTEQGSCGDGFKPKVSQSCEGQISSGVSRFNRAVEAAASGELPPDLCPNWLACGYHILKNAIHRVFVKNPYVTVGMNIKLQ